MAGVPVVFFILAAVAVGTALGMLISQNTIYSALFLVLNFAAVAVLYLILGAPFIALSQITVYAGSIMVLFLFVIMLLGVERLPTTDTLRWQPLAAIPLGLVLALEFAAQLLRGAGRLPAALNVPAAPEGFGAPRAIGELLFTQFLLPFEVTGAILLTATVGAIILARPNRTSVARGLRQAVEDQVLPGERAEAAAGNSGTGVPDGATAAFSDPGPGTETTPTTR
jgi:NADH-quinone oxidoreductase subunit J